MKIKILFLSSVFAFSALSATAEQLTPEKVDFKLSMEQLNQKIHKHELHQRQINWEMAKIKTRDNLDELLTKNSPLDALSPAARERFAESVVFRANGIGGFYTGDLEAELSATQAYRILALFGLQDAVSKLSGLRIETKLDAMLMRPNLSSIAKDYGGYRCESRATCKKSAEYICMSGC